MLKLGIVEGVDTLIPPLYYTRKGQGNLEGCQMLFEVNDEDNDIVDPIKTKADGLDYLTNNGYILGQPFLRAFMILLDFEANKIGLATKKRNFGAELLVTSSSPVDPPPQPHDDED